MTMKKSKFDYEFEGVDTPKRNYMIVPTLISDNAYRMKWYEKTVIDYIVRNTWGYSEFGIFKKITLDEFVNGRKRKNGTRIDHGTGLAKSTIIKALKLAVEHKYIDVIVDDSDGGRAKRSYRIHYRDSSVITECQDYTPEVTRHTPEVTRHTPEVTRHTPIRDSIPTDNKPKNNKPLYERGSQAAEGEDDGGLISFDRGMGVLLYDILVKHESPIAVIPKVNGSKKKNGRKPVTEQTLAQVVSGLRLQFGKERVESVIDWLGDHYDDDYTPKINSVDNLLQFKRIEDAMKRSQNGKNKGRYSRDYSAMGESILKGNGKCQP
jgi:hypothetical protein